MKQRNKLFAGLSLAVAGAAIGGGAIVSANAMADSTTPAAGTMTIISSTDGGTPIKCTFTDVDMPTLRFSAGTPGSGEGTGLIAVSVIGSIDGSLPPGAPVGGADGPHLVTGGQVAPGDDGTASLTISGTATEVAGDGGIVTVTNGSVPEGELPTGAPVLINADDARPGTAEECAALKADFTPKP